MKWTGRDTRGIHRRSAGRVGAQEIKSQISAFDDDKEELFDRIDAPSWVDERRIAYRFLYSIA